MAGSDDSGLIEPFDHLGISSPSSASKLRGKPLPPLPQQPHRRAEQISLPPYLAHLAEPLPSSSSPAAVLFPRPTFPQPQPHYHGVPVTARITHGNQCADPSRLPPRPPIAPSVTQKPLVHTPVPNAHPPSLVPGAIQAVSSQKYPYPWELVPQAKIQQSHPDTQLGQKENRVPIASVSPASNKNSTSITTNPITPPRRRQDHHASSPSLRPLGCLTPNGSQTDASCPPIKGQCWGIKKDGTRCIRKVRTPAFVTVTAASKGHTSKQGKRNDRGSSAPARLAKGASASEPLVLSGSESEDDGPGSCLAARKGEGPMSNAAARNRPSDDLDDYIDEVYCFQHVAEVNKTNGFYPAQSQIGPGVSNTHFVTFSEWFSTIDLDDLTQARLRKRMSQPLSDADRAELGYLYIYELRDRSTSTHVCLKVGRTSNVFRRLGEWRSQCQSKDPLLRSFHPSANHQGLISGMHAASVSGVQLSHRWEALVHVELSGFGRRVDDDCDCGTRHREIFMIPRWLGYRDETQHRQHDGFDVVQKVVLKWMRFVQTLP